MGEVLQFMGDPNYPSFSKKTALMHTNNYELASYFHWILSMAHNLDLARCHPADKYQKSLSRFESIVKPSAEQMDDCNALCQYAVNLMQEHGNATCCAFDTENKLVDAFQDYSDNFVDCNNSFSALQRSTEVIPAPRFSKTTALEEKKLTVYDQANFSPTFSFANQRALEVSEFGGLRAAR